MDDPLTQGSKVRSAPAPRHRHRLRSVGITTNGLCPEYLDALGPGRPFVGPGRWLDGPERGSMVQLYKFAIMFLFKKMTVNPVWAVGKFAILFLFKRMIVNHI